MRTRNTCLYVFSFWCIIRHLYSSKLCYYVVLKMFSIITHENVSHVVSLFSFFCSKKNTELKLPLHRLQRVKIRNFTSYCLVVDKCCMQPVAKRELKKVLQNFFHFSSLMRYFFYNRIYIFIFFWVGLTCFQNLI